MEAAKAGGEIWEFNPRQGSFLLVSPRDVIVPERDGIKEAPGGLQYIFRGLGQQACRLRLFPLGPI